MGSERYGFLWVTDILNSGYPDDDRLEMASMVIQLLWKQLRSDDTGNFPPSRIPPLLDFLSLCENLDPSEGSIALRILATSPEYPDFCARILPVLVSILSPTHPLRSRGLALKIFHRFAAGWFSSEMESVLHKDLNQLLQAVGDPFQFSDPPFQDGRRGIKTDFEPMVIVVVLIELVSSELWWNHLRRSNFTSCEAILSTEGGRRTALRCILETAARSRPEFLDTSTKIITTIKRLEELQCLNTAEAVILWAWTAGVVNVVDHDAWGPIERKTLDFYHTYGIKRLTALSRHITDKTLETRHMMFLLMRYQDDPCRMGSVQQLVSFEEARDRLDARYYGELYVVQACQLRRLYHLFGYDPVTWKEAVGVEEVNEGTDTLSVQLVTPIQFTDWVCDYP